MPPKKLFIIVFKLCLLFEKLAGEDGGEAAGGSLGCLGGLDVGGVKLQLGLAVNGRACLQFGLDERQHLLIGEMQDLGALGLLLRQEQARGDALGAGGEPHGGARLVHEGHVTAMAGRAAATTHDDILDHGHLAEGFGFQLTEAVLAHLIKNLRDGHALAGLDELVEVDEAQPHLTGQRLTQRGLTTAHVTDKENRSHYIGLTNASR